MPGAPYLACFCEMWGAAVGRPLKPQEKCQKQNDESASALAVQQGADDAADHSAFGTLSGAVGGQVLLDLMSQLGNG